MVRNVCLSVYTDLYALTVVWNADCIVTHVCCIRIGTVCNAYFYCAKLNSHHTVHACVVDLLLSV